MAKLELYLKFWGGENYFEAGEKFYGRGGGEITQKMEETVDGRKYFKLPKKRSSKIYGAIGKKKPGGAANLGSAPGGRHPIYAIGS